MGKKPPPLLLYVSPNGYLGGAERFVVDACRGHQEAENYRPHLLFFEDGEAVALARRYHLEVTVLRQRFKLRDPVRLARALAEIRGVHQRLAPAVVHATMPYAHIVCGLALMGLPAKRVWFQHGPVGGTLDKLATLFATDAMLFNSEYLQGLHRSAFPQFNVRRGDFVIPLGVAAAKNVTPLFARDTVVFGAAGRLGPFKAYERLLAAVGPLGTRARLLIAGAAKTASDRAYAEELRARAPANVTFLGHVDDMAGLYAEIDVFLHSSLAPEPFGLVIAEAMAHGRLAVAPAGGGISALLRHGQTGLTYDDPSKLATLVADLASGRDVDALRVLASNGYAEVRATHSISSMAQHLEDVYRTL
jgi:glycosyltransferase involved in cell wall biosynthesis